MDRSVFSDRPWYRTVVACSAGRDRFYAGARVTAPHGDDAAAGVLPGPGAFFAAALREVIPNRSGLSYCARKRQQQRENRMSTTKDESPEQPAADHVDGKLTLGWREWVALPEFDIGRIKAKVDTGARTSCLHTFRTETYTEGDQRRVRFWVHPVQNNLHQVAECDAAILDERNVSDSGGHQELRLVVETRVIIGGEEWPIEMTLTNRDSMRFRMLLGRTAMAGRALVIPECSYLAGEPALRKNE